MSHSILDPAKTDRILPGPAESNGHTRDARSHSKDPATPPPQRKWTVTRVVVLGVVALVTLSVLPTGAVWAYYRLQHTVVDNATVRGHVHKIGARIDGQVESVEVQPGQRVLKDQVLFRLADSSYQAAVRTAQAQLQSAVNRLEAEKITIEYQHKLLPMDVEKCEHVCRAREATVAADVSARDKAEHEYDRISALVQSHIATASDMDTASAARDSARAEVEAAKGNLAAAESDLLIARMQVEALRARDAGLEVLVSQVELARQQLSVAEADLAATVVRAPAAGWVIDYLVEPGGSAKVGEPMMSLWLGAPWVEAWVDEKKLSGVRIGNPADVTLAAFPKYKLRGRVEGVGVLADKELQALPVPATLHSFFTLNSMVPIRISVPGDQIRLQPGLTVVVGIEHSAAHPSQVTAKGRDEFIANSTKPDSRRVSALDSELHQSIAKSSPASPKVSAEVAPSTTTKEAGTRSAGWPSLGVEKE
jgi:membrane fusion protein (multidrug efflux system)